MQNLANLDPYADVQQAPHFFLRVGPINFQEYLLAVEKEVMAEALTGNPESIAASSHGLILQELRNYFFVGGMPEAVKLWRDTGSMREAARVQEEILQSLRDDFSKYTPRVAPDCLDARSMPNAFKS